MGTFNRVDATEAGAQALGILVPPGKRTFVILRPRSLPWDLLVTSPHGSFAQLSHDEASASAQGLFRALREGLNRLQIAEFGAESRVHAQIGEFLLCVCLREPGKPYRPLGGSEDELRPVVEQLGEVLCPLGTAVQEVYFNMRFFDR